MIKLTVSFFNVVVDQWKIYMIYGIEGEAPINLRYKSIFKL